MQRNLEEIISYMNERFRPYEVFDKQLKRITRELMERGYTLDEITRGVNTYLLQLEPAGSDYKERQEEPPKREPNLRVLDIAESRWIRPGAYGYLCLLREMGLLNHQETEELIGYIVENELELESGEDLQQIMLEMIFEGEADRKMGCEDEDYEDGDLDFPVLHRKSRRLL
ncbi:MAG: DUF494 family protein [Candidatus Glassbacteria bacterium]|nr:DUF494 family protein [Candidatus Glassbacteria bacterium]